MAGFQSPRLQILQKLENLQTLCKSCHRKKTNSEVVLKGKGKVNYKKII